AALSARSLHRRSSDLGREMAIEAADGDVQGSVREEARGGGIPFEGTRRRSEPREGARLLEPEAFGILHAPSVERVVLFARAHERSEEHTSELQSRENL